MREMGLLNERMQDDRVCCCYSRGLLHQGFCQIGKHCGQFLPIINLSPYMCPIRALTLLAQRLSSCLLRCRIFSPVTY